VKVSLIYFKTDNCPACKTITPMFETLKADYEDCEVSFNTIVITAANRQVADEWNIRGVPTIALVEIKEAGETPEEIARFVGTEQITRDALIYGIESRVYNEQGNLQPDLLSE
jgi:thiol-disulfide isomerase/thioredoxin